MKINSRKNIFRWLIQCFFNFKWKKKVFYFSFLFFAYFKMHSNGMKVFGESLLLIRVVFCVLFFVLFVFVMCLVNPLLPVSLDCLLLIPPSVFSNVYLNSDYQQFHQYQQHKKSWLTWTFWTQTKKILTYFVGHPDPGLRQTQICDRLKLTGQLDSMTTPSLSPRIVITIHWL